MLIFELSCEAGHNFEGWFDDLKDLEMQIGRKKLACPLCGSKNVRKVLSPVAIGGKSKAVPAQPLGEPTPEQTSKITQKALNRYLAENFEDVGASFFKEALKMHYGAIPARNIRGVSSAQEEETLRQEGVDFFKFNDDSRPIPPSPAKNNKPSH